MVDGGSKPSFGGTGELPLVLVAINQQATPAEDGAISSVFSNVPVKGAQTPKGKDDSDEGNGRKPRGGTHESTIASLLVLHLPPWRWRRRRRRWT